MLMCAGTLGDTLSSNPDLYISRDGGVTWHETLSGSYGANVLDHGGIIVAVNDYHQVSSTVLKYSCNEGLSWNSFTFTDVSLRGNPSKRTHLFNSKKRQSSSCPFSSLRRELLLCWSPVYTLIMSLRDKPPHMK